jgi:hypothetical protein
MYVRVSYRTWNFIMLRTDITLDVSTLRYKDWKGK